MEQIIESILGIDITIRPSVKPEMNSFTFDFVTLVRASFINNKIFNYSVA